MYIGQYGSVKDFSGIRVLCRDAFIQRVSTIWSY